MHLELLSFKRIMECESKFLALLYFCYCGRSLIMRWRQWIISIYHSFWNSSAYFELKKFIRFASAGGLGLEYRSSA